MNDIIRRADQMETLYLNLIHSFNSTDFFTLKRYYNTEWADDRDFIFTETDLSYSIFDLNQLAHYFDNMELKTLAVNTGY